MTATRQAAMTSVWTVTLVLVSLIVGGNSASVLPMLRGAHGGHLVPASAGSRRRPAKSPGSCAVLNNKGSHSTVRVEVGTPPQAFDVVADTGSDTFIVESCICQQTGTCPQEDSCFIGTNKSKSFALIRREVTKDDMKEFYEANGITPPANKSEKTSRRRRKHKAAKTLPQDLMLSFGSGEIGGVLARDILMVGSASTNMSEGFMLMTEARLNIAMSIQGILGLGPPNSLKEKAQKEMEAEMKKEKEEKAKIEKAEKAHKAKAHSSTADDDNSTAVEDGQGLPKSIQDIIDAMKGMAQGSAGSGDEAAPTEPETVHAKESPKGFMEQAGLTRFSMCFIDGQNGTLRFQPPVATTSHKSIGMFHWGVGLDGVSIGKHHTKLKFCNTSNMSKGQDSPCGAIPDSGTTLLTGPADQVVELVDSLCDNWPRCSENHTAMVNAAKLAHESAEQIYNVDPWAIKAADKKTILETLLAECGTWLDNETGLNELPSINFHVSGHGGTKQKLALSPLAYVIEEQREEVETTNIDIPGIGTLPIGVNHTGHFQKVCSLAFGTIDYNTQKNGPIWILGTSLFYEYVVGYDISENTVSFSSMKDVPCGSCSSDGERFFSTSPAALLSTARTTGRFPRRVMRPFRKPSVDTSFPL